MRTHIEDGGSESKESKLAVSNCGLNQKVVHNSFESMIDGFRTFEIDISLLKEEESKEDCQPDVHNFHSRLSPEHYDWCIELLESPRIVDNRKGLQLLSLLVKFRINLNSSEAITNVAETVVYDNDNTLKGGKVRDLLLTYLCDPERVEFGEDLSISAASSVNDKDCFTASYSIDSLDVSSCGEDVPRGYHWGALHAPALRVVVNCLEQALAAHKSTPTLMEGGMASRHLECSSSFWNKIFSTLSHNLEKGHSADISGYSLRLLRLLQQLEPAIVNQLLQYSLLPFILELQEYGRVHNYPLIQDETARIITRLKSK